MYDTLLLIEDEPLLSAELVRHFRRAGFEVMTATTLAQAKRLLLHDEVQPLVVISDMSLPDGNALDLLEATRSHATGAEWLFLTGYGGVADSVRALRLGAFDFLEKPCELERLDLVVAGAARGARAQRRLRERAAAENRRYTPEAFVGRSAAARSVRELLARLASVPLSTLLLTGETGTGKGLAARILHYSGARREGPLVEVNCAALPHDLLESELFGYEPGAFTGAKGRRRGLMEQAQGGTIFLDEIGELGLDLQAKLLTVIEDRRLRRLGGSGSIEIDVQVIAASNRNLAERAHAGDFRSDLYHRITVFTLELPALRQRGEDLDDLVPLFVAEYNAKAGKSVRVIPDPVWAALRTHDWPGNVRELRNVLERCVLLSDTQTIAAHWLQLEAPPGTAQSNSIATGADRGLHFALDGSLSLDDMEKKIIGAALERSDNNVTAAARLLGTSRETLRYRIGKYGFKSEE
ncbi:MAG TPA: sigma-54 dependent transcriptional regulator [Burkholderiales bacterium]|nr:sigma-54 dependent transcriptional regulator [Burkholderiales bacterium]